LDGKKCRGYFGGTESPSKTNNKKIKLISREYNIEKCNIEYDISEYGSESGWG
jgi:hypothetical protein